MRRIWHFVQTVGVVLVAVVLLGACNVSVDRNTDGSLTAETTVSEATIQSEIAAALSGNNANLTDVTVDLRDGAIYVAGTGSSPDGNMNGTVTFRLDLGVEDGRLTATISEAQLNGNAIDDARVATWNDRIARRLERMGQNQRNSTLQSVSIENDTLTMVWRVETRRSQS